VGITIWSEMTLKFKDAISKAIDLMKERDVENIPGARDRLLSTFELLTNQFKSPSFQKLRILLKHLTIF
jgi:hypothetical protein